MDSLSQLALGAAVGQAVLGHKVGRKAALWGAVLGTLPDLDVLVSYDNAVEDFTYHRSASHSLFVMAAASPPMAWLIGKIHAAERQPWRGWLILVFLALATHPLLDCFTAYGTQILWPLDLPPTMWATMFIIDPLYTLPLLVGLLLVFWKGGQRRLARRANAAGLLLSCTYLAWSAIAGLEVRQVATQTLVYQRLSHQHLMATPAPFNTLLWRVVAVDHEAYYEGFYSLLDPEPKIEFQRFANEPELLTGLEDHWPVTRLQWFTQGLYAVRRAGNEIALTDLRMGQEPAYIFQFVVGEMVEGQIVPRPGLQQREEFDPRALGWVWQRIWRPQPPLTRLQ
ncbi:MAG: metal-dependent hydrolase [Candidatus Latescibacteria bacterium]|nr:metal-dependent hydrolase [Candidatus Latescibacterota bacterium]